MRFDTILFDLDGTLTDSGPGIVNSIRYALEQAGMPVPPWEELRQFIGPPLLEAFQEVYGVSRTQSEALLRQFRVYFEKTGIYENRPYDGIPDMLGRLQRAGCRLLVATSKPEVFAERILERFGLRPYFSGVTGSDIDETRTAKDAVIACALEQAGVSDRSRAVMVGDRRHDVLGARANGLAVLGVLYGYGSREELEDAGADALAETVPDVARLLLEAGN